MLPNVPAPFAFPPRRAAPPGVVTTVFACASRGPPGVVQIVSMLIVAQEDEVNLSKRLRGEGRVGSLS